jgi:hypothetical protein
MTDSPKARSGIVNIRKQFRKTKLCSYYLAGRCTFGSQCFYAHNPEDVHDAPDLKKTKLCIAWPDGKCAKRADCGFAHGAKELRSTVAVYKTVQCQWYSTGHCSLGSSCRYAHGDQEDRSKLTTDESAKKKKKKKTVKDKKPELPVNPEASPMPTCQPCMPVAAVPVFDPVAAAVQSEFLRSMEHLKGNGDVLQQIVNLCTRLQLTPEDLPPPPPGLPSPFRVPADAHGKASPKGATPEGLSTPSTIASTAGSPQFSPLDLGNSFVAAGSPMHQGVPLNHFAFPRMADNEMKFQHFQLPLFAGLAPQ